MNQFIFQGGAENVNFFHLTDAARRRLQYFWTCHKGARKGDTAFIYLCAPLSRIVGRVELIGEPFENIPNMFQNPYMAGKLCVEIEFREYLDESLDLLTARNLKTLFGKDWGWSRYPRGATRIPDSILPPFLELVGRVRHLTRIAGIMKESSRGLHFCPECQAEWRCLDGCEYSEMLCDEHDTTAIRQKLGGKWLE